MHSRVVVVGSDTAELYRSLFYLDDPNAALQVIEAGSTYDLSTLPQGKDWALVIGDHPWIGGTSESPTRGFTLVRRDDATTSLDFNMDSRTRLVSRTSGHHGLKHRHVADG